MEEWAINIFTIILIIVLTIVILILVKITARRLYSYIDDIEGIRKNRRKQTITFVQIITWSISVTAVCVGVLMILSEFGVDITPLLASVGIAGLALGLGAQTLIRDFIGGFLILLENQFVVGDTIKLDTLTGEVERITLRATYLRDIRGLQYIVPNGEVRIVSNQNKEWARAIVDVNIAYGEDLNRVASILGMVGEDFSNDPNISTGLLDKPQVSGPVVAADWTITMRLMVKTRADRQIEITRELQKRVLQVCETEGVLLSYPRHELWLGQSDGSSKKTS
jgi:small-conductance mechanosensitive channel